MTKDPDRNLKPTAEEQRLEEARQRTKHWKRWGPYLSERAWGTVREDNSRMGRRGIISHTITHGRAPIVGMKTGSRASAIVIRKSVSRWRYGMAAIQS